MGKALLESIGYRVITAFDGVDALTVFRQHQNDIACVLMDLSMPRMDGWEALSQVRKLRADVPAVLTSGFEEAQAIRARPPESREVFLHKPYQRRELMTAIANAFRRQDKIPRPV